MTPETFRWLLTPSGQELLAAAAEVAAAHGPLRANELLRRDAGADAERIAAALEQVTLRERARDKFGERAGAMYFTAEALEQATRSAVAEHRAARARAAGLVTAVDLGCGLGGDLVALAGAGLVAAGVDRDPLRVEIARANLAALGLGGAVQVADAETVDHSPFELAFADPSRRTARGRSFDAADWSPPWSFVSELLRRDSCVKVAPGIPHSMVPAAVEAEWVSDGGEVKEAALWSGRLSSVRRRATVIPRTSAATRTDPAAAGLATLTDEDPVDDRVLPIGSWLYEPDGAVIRAGLVTAVAAGVHGGLLDPKIAYVTADEPFRTPFARTYEVLEELPFRERQLRTALRERGVGPLTIKKRGVQVVPEQLRRRLDLHGDASATIVLTRVGGHGTCLLVRPLAPPPAGQAIR